MKKSMISMALLLGLLVGCSNSDDTLAKAKADKTGGQVIATLSNDKDNYSATMYANEIYNEFLNSNTGSSNLFNQLYKAVINAMIEPDDYELFEKEVADQMREWVSNAKEQASTNNVSKDVMIEELLSGEGVKTIEELTERNIYEKVKEKVEKDYFDNNREDFLTNWVNEYFPFHIRGILVKVSNSGDSSLYDRSITEDEAKKLNLAFSQLRAGVDFIELAGDTNISDHSESQLRAGGSLGIMDITESYNSEFKYGIYSYIARNENVATELVDKLEIPNSYAELYEDGFNVITNDDLALLRKAIDMKENFTADNSAATSDYAGEEINESTLKGNFKSSLVARNVVFNNLFNSHAVSFLQATDRTVNKVNITTGYKNGVNWSGDVVANSKGEPILVLTDENGVQFISLDQNPFTNPALTAKYYSSSADLVYHAEKDGVTVFAESVAAQDETLTYESFVPYASQGYSDKSIRKQTVDTLVKKFINRGYNQGLSANEQFFNFHIFLNKYQALKDNKSIKGLGETEKGLKLETQVLDYVNNIIAYRDAQYAKAKVDNWKDIEKALRMQNERKVWVRPLDIVEGTAGNFATWTELVEYWAARQYGGAL